MNKDMKYNTEHYRDRTAKDALRRADSTGREDLVRLSKAVHEAKRIFNRQGFEVLGRIILRDNQSGRIYR